MKNWLDLISRMCLATIFLYEAYDSIAYFQQTKKTMDAYGLSSNQDLMLTGAIVLLLLGGILILIGYKASFGAFLLLVYWIPLTFIVHSFWNDPVEVRRLQSIMFMKNIAITGGLLAVLVNGAGKYSVKRLLAAVRSPRQDI